MMIDVRKNLSGLVLLSAGLLGACSVQSSDTQVNTMDTFEARKAVKGDDGSVATTLGEPVAVSVAVKQEEKPVINDWMLSVEPVKRAFMIGEPVVVRVKLQNVSDEPLEVAPLLQPEFQQTTYTITRLDTGASAPFVPAARYLALPAAFSRVFQPGEFVEEEVKLIASKAGWMFKWPGEYEIAVDFDASTSGANVMGNHSTLITVLSGNADDQAAAKLIMDGEAALLLYWEQGDHATDGLAALGEIISRYPQTIHALYAHFALGSNDAQPFFNGEFTRPPRAKSAIGHLEQVRAILASADAPVLPAALRAATYSRLASSYVLAGQADRARAVLDEFLAEYAADPVMTSAMEQIREQRAGL